MGLDVSFSREKAVTAGMEIKKIPNGLPEQIEEAQERGDDAYYLDWLQGFETCMKIPGTDYYSGIGDDRETCMVRANKWGKTYKPLTDWLYENDIIWSEA